MEIAELPQRIKHLVPTKAELAAVRDLANDFPGVSDKWPNLLKLVDNFPRGSTGDWGVMRWTEVLSGSASVAVSVGSVLHFGGRLELRTGTTPASGAYIRQPTTTNSGRYKHAAISFQFFTSSNPATTGAAGDAIMRVGWRGTNASYYQMLESDSANSPNTWVYKTNPNVGTPVTVDTGVSVDHYTLANAHIWQASIIGSYMNERLFGGSAGKARVILIAHAGGVADRMFDAEIDEPETLYNPYPFIELVNKAAVDKRVYINSAAFWQFCGARNSF